MADGDGHEPEQPMPYRIETRTRASRVLALAGIVLVLVLAALPAFAGRGLIQDLIFVFYMMALAQCWNLLAGYAGLVSVGPTAFVGLGGYLLFALTIGAGVDPIAALVLSGVIAAGFAIPTAFVVFRLRGPYFAIGSWVVAEVAVSYTREARSYEIPFRVFVVYEHEGDAWTTAAAQVSIVKPTARPATR